MKSKRFYIPALLLLVFAMAPAVFAQEDEVSFLVGHLKPSDSTLTLNPIPPAETAFSGSFTYQINYTRRVINGEIASLHFEIPVIVAPRVGVQSNNVLLPRTYSTIIFTPGVKLKIFPGRGFSPYVVSGIGFGRFSTSSTNINGSPNTADTSNTSFVFDFGGGVDFKLLGPLSLRGEVRDFIAGTPNLNATFSGDRQNNLYVGIGFVLKLK